jgi:putative ABC transport system permease protein
MKRIELSPRWSKLFRDTWLEKERVLLMFSALVMSLFAVATILGAWKILGREIRTNYLSTRPAMATLEMARGIDAGLIRHVKKLPSVVEAEAHEVVQARVKVGEDWLPLLVFASDSMESLRLSRYFPESGAWPAPTGTILLERTAAQVLQVGTGEALQVKMPSAPNQSVKVTGIVHDPGLSPAYQERVGYAYASVATLKALGEDPSLHELRVTFLMEGATTARVKVKAEALATTLTEAGFKVHQIRVPPFEYHPHQIQMETVLLMLVLFAMLALILSAVLVATTLSAWLSRQTRELAILKTVGARSGQIATIYMTFVAVLGLSATVVAWTLGSHAAILFAGNLADLLNFTLFDTSIPWSAPLIVVLSGVGIPLLVAYLPIRSASHATVREAISDWGAKVSSGGSLLAKLPQSMRQLFRRPRRLALSLLLLGSSGGIFMTSLNVRDGWTATLDAIGKTRHYDVEVRFRDDQPDSILKDLEAVSGVVKVESWGWSPASLARPGKIDLVQVWPDKGHGSLSLVGMPIGTKLVSFPLMEGRRLTEADTMGAVINHIAWIQSGKPGIGAQVLVGIDGRILSTTLVGVIEEVGSPAMVYVTPHTFATFDSSQGRSRMIRVVTSAKTPKERTEILQNLERAMEAKDLPVQVAIPFSELKTAIGDHMKILVSALFALAGVMGLVGMLGLASVTGMGVLERTREFGVLKTLGATTKAIMRMVLSEALWTGWISWILGFALALPLTLVLDRIIGSLGFLAPLPLVIGWAGPVGWLLVVLVISVIAGWIPARRAARLTIREALAQV